MKLDVQKIETMIDRIKTNLGIDYDASISIQDICSKLNDKLTIVKVGISDQVDGMIFKGTTSQAIIVLNSKNSLAKVRYTFLHELYHYYFFNKIEYLVCRTGINKKNKNDEEYNADLFAEYFILPQKSLNQFIEKFCNSIIDLDNIIKIEQFYKVERTIILNRLLKNKMINETDYTKFLKIDIKEIERKGYDPCLYLSLSNTNKLHVTGNYFNLVNNLLNQNKINISKYNELVTDARREDLIINEKNIS